MSEPQNGRGALFAGGLAAILASTCCLGPLVSCCVCCKEIPLDAAFTPEGAEYVEHFCGLECYQRFAARARAEADTGTDPIANASPRPKV